MNQANRAQIEEEGKSIARELGVRYLYTQYHSDGFFHLLHDDAVTGSSFATQTLEEAKEVLSQRRKGFTEGKALAEGRL